MLLTFNTKSYLHIKTNNGISLLHAYMVYNTYQINIEGDEGESLLVIQVRLNSVSQTDLDYMIRQAFMARSDLNIQLILSKDSQTARSTRTVQMS